MNARLISWESWCASLDADPCRRVFAAELAVAKDGLGLAHDPLMADLIHDAKVALWRNKLDEVARLLDQITKRLGRKV
jgi:hypothetical protein